MLHNLGGLGIQAFSFTIAYCFQESSIKTKPQNAWPKRRAHRNNSCHEWNISDQQQSVISQNYKHDKKAYMMHVYIGCETSSDDTCSVH